MPSACWRHRESLRGRHLPRRYALSALWGPQSFQIVLGEHEESGRRNGQQIPPSHQSRKLLAKGHEQLTSERDGQPINGTAEELCGLQAVLNCELPNNMTNDFNGSVAREILLLWLVNDDGAVGERRIERSEGIGVDQERSAARMHSEEHQIRVWRCDFDGNRHESGVQTQPSKMVPVQRIACCSVSKIGARQADRSDAATEPIDLSDGDRPGDSLHDRKRRAIPSLCRAR